MGPPASSPAERAAPTPAERPRRRTLGTYTGFALLEPGPGRVAAVTAATGVALGAALWTLDAAVDAWLFCDRSFAHELLDPAPMDVWVRSLLVVTAALFSFLYLRLRRAERRSRVFSGAIEHAPDGVQLADLQGRVVYSNRAVERIYGASRQTYLGRHVDEMNVDPDFASREILPSLRASGSWQGEVVVKHESGKTFPIWLTTAMLRDHRDRPLAMVGIIRDVSERNAARDRLERYAAKLESTSALKELFADIMRHDLVNPASTIKMSSDMLLRLVTDGEQRHLLGAIRRGAMRVIDMCENAARYARLTALDEVEFRDLDLGDMLRTLATDLELPLADKAQSLVLDIPGPARGHVSPLVGDVFANLLSNAVKYSPRGATIEVVVRDDGSHLVIEVRDRGEGIDDAHKQRVFERFERVDKGAVKGTGLGLAIARRIVDLHHGAIWVEDNPGGGSVFKVRLGKAARAR